MHIPVSFFPSLIYMKKDNDTIEMENFTYDKHGEGWLQHCPHSIPLASPQPMTCFQFSGPQTAFKYKKK
uniref:Uncharacterized protein n=1 Tax=Rhizophora mucronata TaxID=61149 RepID=A0A2P2P4K1_RHIMU